MTPAARMAACLTAQTRKRVDFDVLAGAADDGDASLPTSPLRRRVLAAAARELATTGLVRLPVGDRSWDRSAHPPLPRWVERTTPSRVRAPRPGPRAWVTALAFATRTALSKADLALLDPINVFLRDRPDAEPVPLAERFYELYGDEKYLSRPDTQHLVAADLLSIPAHLRAFAAPAPLAMFELGPAPWMLIVENSAAFTSLRRILATWPAAEEVGWLAYGGGDHLIASLTTCAEAFAERRHPVTDVLLYTDLDVDGLECAQLAAARARRAGLPELIPAAGLYHALMHQSPRPWPPAAPGRIRAAVSWLPPCLTRQAEQLLLDGHVLRQEALPLDRLRAHLTAGAPLLPQLLGSSPASGRG
ncbi:hypothetical protein AB0A77_33310 [Streptomyces varsoviensis]|uniref:hypothetical protein n=1 Tax=Streptomyces varsoviensis TaxID=67373 RepID=UPI0033E711AA